MAVIDINDVYVLDSTGTNVDATAKIPFGSPGLTTAQQAQARKNIGAVSQTEVDVLDARMDEFASLPDGSTAGDAELLDIRVGADGKTWPSAGDAVRGQVADLNSALSDAVGVSTTWEEGYYFNSYGAKIEYSPFEVSDFIPLEKNGITFDLYFTVYGNSATYCVYYDANKTQIGVEQIGSELHGTTKGIANVAYVRLTNTIGKTPVISVGNIRDMTVVVNFPGDIGIFGGIEVGGWANAEKDNSVAYRMRSGKKFTVPISLTFTTDWTKYNAVIGYYENGAWSYSSWLSADVVVKPNVLCLFVVGRKNFSSTPLSETEINEIKASTKFRGNTYFLNAVDNRWTGKMWCCVGDSLTGINVRTDKHYFDYVSEETGISVINMGVSGTGYANDGGSNKAFYQRIANVPLESDVVTIFGSLNDLASGKSLGTINDSGTTTIAGCINTTIDNLFAAYPLVNLGIVTPTPWQYYNPFSANASAVAYVQTIVDICEKRGIPCLDLFHCSGLRPWDADFRALAYTKDDGNGTHPDETGHKIIAPRFEAFLETLLL